ncbi:hypothetical protein [Deinococcus multiflagellatus]|uniref:Uncharacterized protein n=1 Tax=Deinococcus multiflagellatus TaxID=1656887 RepID=A0ABW1ZR08_9DEIO|nr:hypothetical protein [Deinococcus multiflagellatus]MBZ9715923.1 hypothetical protein [Deinococcus multiflagellatus]
MVATGSRLGNRSPHVGVMVGPRTGGLAPLAEGRWWASDNDGYNGKFDPERFLQHLARLQPYASRCLFVAAPDVVQDAGATLALFPRWRQVIEQHDFPTAYIAQDGQERLPLPDNANWLFLAGSDRWRGQHGAALIAQARDLGYWGIHVGRVNSARRVRACTALGVDSCDGTYLRFTGVHRGLADVERWVESSAQQGGLFTLEQAA